MACVSIYLALATAIASALTAIGHAADGAVGFGAGATNRWPALRGDIQAGVESWTGDATYRIGGAYVLADGARGKTWFPISELEFPLDVSVGAVQASARFGARWVFGARAAVSLSSDAGTMHDTDWVTGPDTIDIASTSDAALDLWEAYAYVRFALPSTGVCRVAVGAGFLRQQLAFTVSNLDQWYPSATGPDAAHDRFPGQVATYDATCSIPYAEVVLGLALLPSVDGGIRLAFSPFTAVEDEDHHLLRDKVSRADDDGTAVMAEAACRYRHRSGWFGSLTLAVRYIEAEGLETQEDAGEPVGTIEHRFESRQSALRAAVGCGL